MHSCSDRRRWLREFSRRLLIGFRIDFRSANDGATPRESRRLERTTRPKSAGKSQVYNAGRRVDTPMRLFKKRAASMLFFSLAVSVHAQQPMWKDPSPHTTRFVTVEKGVRL